MIAPPDGQRRFPWAALMWTHCWRPKFLGSRIRARPSISPRWSSWDTWWTRVASGCCLPGWRPSPCIQAVHLLPAAELPGDDQLLQELHQGGGQHPQAQAQEGRLAARYGEGLQEGQGISVSGSHLGHPQLEPKLSISVDVSNHQVLVWLAGSLWPSAQGS